jgi:membrane protein involved in colicin uptake
MATSNTVWIIVAVVVAILVIGGLVLAARSRRNTKMHGEAERIRGEVEQESVQVARREALADETAAKARAAAAEAEAKAAEARRLEQRAESHRSSVDTARGDLDERRAHADSIDPRVKADKTDDDAVAAEEAAYDRPADGQVNYDANRDQAGYDQTSPPAAHRA